MSFSHSVKNEIYKEISDKDKKFACLYGLLFFSRKISLNELIFQTESSISAKIFTELIEDVFKGRIVLKTEKTERASDKYLYSFSAANSEDINIIIDTFKLLGKREPISFDSLDGINHDAFLSGAFFACGSVSDPNKEYHLEFVLSNEQLYNIVFSILSPRGIIPKKTYRKGSVVLYIKESENIEDILTFMGAPMCSLEIMNIKIYKDVRNKANRLANCDSANIEKTIYASERQIKAIGLIQEKIGLISLPHELSELAQLRIDNPEMSLKELGEALEKPLGRSGVSHRMKKIENIASKL